MLSTQHFLWILIDESLHAINHFMNLIQFDEWICCQPCAEISILLAIVYIRINQFVVNFAASFDGTLNKQQRQAFADNLEWHN